MSRRKQEKPKHLLSSTEVQSLPSSVCEEEGQKNAASEDDSDVTLLVESSNVTAEAGELGLSSPRHTGLSRY